MKKSNQVIEDIPVITIDGPSGSGKGTVSRLLAQKLGWHFLDSGALYRVLALAALKQKIDLTDIDALQRLAINLEIKRNTTATIRAENVSIAASQVAALKEIREILLVRQRSFRKAPGLVADGRDMGTVVFPDAKIKIFLTASDAERAKRRHKQLQQQEINVSLHDTSRELQQRDMRDKRRSISPLKPAKDATIIDTTDLTVDEVLARIMKIIDY